MSGELRTQAPDLKGFLAKHAASIQQVATQHITADRMVKLVCAAASREPRLAECSPLSILRSMVQAAELGLEVCSGKNEAYLVPRWNKKAKVLEATFLPGYQGLIKLAVETGRIRNIEARVVHAKDQFEYELGITPILKHKPHLGAERGEIIAVYAVAFLADGSTQFEVMAKDEIDEIRDRSKEEKTFSPWTTDYAEMARKTVVRRLFKYLPKSNRMAQALAIQAKAEVWGADDLEPEVVRPGEIGTTPTLSTNEDGALEHVWTDEDREATKTFIYEQADFLAEKGVPDEEVQEFIHAYQSQVGDPETSPEKVQDRAFNNAAARARKASA